MPFQKFISVLITFVAINNEETPKKDFASKYFLEVKTVAIRTKPPFNFISWTCRYLPIKYVSVMEEDVWKYRSSFEKFRKFLREIIFLEFSYNIVAALAL